MPRHRHRSAVLALLLVWLAAGAGAREQRQDPQPDPVEILRRADAALRQAAWLEYDFEYLGTFGSRGRASGHARVAPVAFDGALEFEADVDMPLPPATVETFPAHGTFALTAGRAWRLDAESQIVDVASRASGGAALVRNVNLYVAPQLMRTEPYGIEIRQPVEHRWAGRAVVGGVACDVVYLRFAADSGLGEQYLYFGVDDHLMRRLIFNSPGGLGREPAHWQTTWRNVRRGTAPSAEGFAPEPPAGWRVVDHDGFPAQVGDRVPAWTLTSSSGAEVESADLAGKIQVLDFWATWCPFCRSNLPFVEALRRDYAEHPVRVLSIQMWDSADAEAYLREMGLDLEVLVAGDELAERFQVGGTPTVVVVGPDGRILLRDTTSGEERDETLRRVLDQALSDGT